MFPISIKVSMVNSNSWYLDDLLGSSWNVLFLLGHAGNLGEEEFLEGLGHHHDVLSGLVVDVAVGEDCVEVLDALLGAPVVVVVETFLDGAEVHGVLDYLVVVRDVEFVSVHWGLWGSR